MYITINDIKGEKRFDLSYSIQNFDSSKDSLGAHSVEIAVIRMLSDNVNPISTGGVFSTPCPVNGSELHNGTS